MAALTITVEVDIDSTKEDPEVVAEWIVDTYEEQRRYAEGLPRVTLATAVWGEVQS